MSKDISKLSEQDLDFLVNTIVQNGKNLKTEVEQKKYERLLKRDICVIDSLVLTDLTVNRAMENLTGQLQPMLMGVLETQQVQDKLLDTLGVTAEQKQEAYDSVKAENAEAVKAQMEIIEQKRKEAEESKDGKVLESVNEEGLKVQEVQNNVDLSLNQGE